MNKNNFFTTQTIAKIAILSAIAVVLMMFETPVPFLAPPFYKLDLSELPVIIGGFALGPLAAVCIEALKIVINTLFTGSSTAYVGEVANFIIGIAFAVPAAYFYKKAKSKKHAIQGLVIGTVCMTVTGVLLNYFVLIPAYSTFYGLAEETIVGMGSAIFPFITNRLTFVLACTSPFNIFKGLIVSILTMLIYKHISPLLHK